MRQERKGEKKGKRGGSTGGCLIFIVTGWLTKLKRGESFQCAFSKLWSWWWWSWRWHISHKFFFLEWLTNTWVCIYVCLCACVCVCYVQRKVFPVNLSCLKFWKKKPILVPYSPPPSPQHFNKTAHLCKHFLFKKRQPARKQEVRKVNY